MGGRGAGKTRSGAEFIRARTQDGKAKRIALLGATLGDVREVMIEGPSGLKNIGPKDMQPVYESSRRRLTWPNGALAYAFSAEDPDSLRGPQFDCAWCDEFASWRYPQRSLSMLQMGLRLGDNPQAAITTTPKPIPALKDLIDQPGTVVTRASTYDNAAYLADDFLSYVQDRWGQTRLGRQELLGELVEDMPGALWNRAMLEACRTHKIPTLARIVIGVDPPASSSEKANACGIIVAATFASDDGAVADKQDQKAVILADETLEQATPLQWAQKVADCAQKYHAQAIVAEVNQGGDMVREMLKIAGLQTRLIMVHASKGKRLRAEPVLGLYEQGRVHHLGAFPMLEDEMCSFGSDAFAGTRSPDRLDAMVWAITELLLRSSRQEPSIRHL